jgi:ribonuclease-3
VSDADEDRAERRVSDADEDRAERRVSDADEDRAERRVSDTGEDRAERTSEADAEGREAALDALEARLGHRFARRALLETALCHASHANEASGTEGGVIEHNERLEFLGDAVLDLVVAEALYRGRPDWREGELSRARRALVEGRSLARLARSLDLGRLLRLGRSELRTGGRDKDTVLENAMEAVIGALYLDGGARAARAFLERVFAAALSQDAAPARRDPKTELQERTMAVDGTTPSYVVVEDSGIEDDDERFTVEVRLGDRPLARSVGRTKRAAERRAAARALEGGGVEPAGAARV